MSRIDAFFEVIAGAMQREMDDLDQEASDVRHWVVIEDAVGVEVSPVEDSRPHEVLPSFMALGVRGAAYVTYVPERPERLLAYALVANAADSDVRQTHVVREEGGVTSLAPWERTV